MADREQKLVNAQTEVNRAVFLMNARNNRPHHSLLTDADLMDEKIRIHIDCAITALKLAREGYLSQSELF